MERKEETDGWMEGQTNNLNKTEFKQKKKNNQIV